MVNHMFRFTSQWLMYVDKNCNPFKYNIFIIIILKRHTVTKQFPVTSRIPSNTNATTVGSFFTMGILFIKHISMHTYINTI
jgi:hypothetical protein